MRFLCVALLALLFFCSCGERKGDDNAAARAAKEYYDLLIAGRYVDYIDGMAQADSIPPSYHEQLLANAKQFLAIQRKDHNGIVNVSVVSAQTDSTRNVTNAFLLLTFGDSTKEEIVVPMLERDGHWLMK